MPAKVWIPPLLRRHTADREELLVAGCTLSEVLAGLGAAGSVVTSMLSRNGNRAADVTLFVNGRPVAGAEGLSLAISDGDEVVIMPAIGGGR